MELPAFYLNVVILNKDEVVKAKVQEKVGAGYFGIMAKLAAGAASSVVSDDKFAATIASKLVESIPAKVADMGITMTLQTSFQKGSFLVLRAQVTHIDEAVLLKRVKGDEFAAKFAELQTLLEFFNAADARANVRAKIQGMVQTGLLNKLEEILPAKLQEGNVAVTVTAKRDTEQAEFFFSFLASLSAP